jgi:hypothetical protein
VERFTTSRPLVLSRNAPHYHSLLGSGSCVRVYLSRPSMGSTELILPASIFHVVMWYCTCIISLPLAWCSRNRPGAGRTYEGLPP